MYWSCPRSVHNSQYCKRLQQLGGWQHQHHVRRIQLDVRLRQYGERGLGRRARQLEHGGGPCFARPLRPAAVVGRDMPTDGTVRNREAVGTANTATGFNSTVVGSTNTASGAFSSTFGNGNTASVFSSTALGNTNTATGF